MKVVKNYFFNCLKKFLVIKIFFFFFCDEIKKFPRKKKKEYQFKIINNYIIINSFLPSQNLHHLIPNVKK